MHMFGRSTLLSPITNELKNKVFVVLIRDILDAEITTAGKYIYNRIAALRP